MGVKVNIGFFGALTLIFITLKLLGKIAWSWWWVLSPLWIPPLFAIAIFLVIIILMLGGFITWEAFKRGFRR